VAWEEAVSADESAIGRDHGLELVGVSCDAKLHEAPLNARSNALGSEAARR
jgi:hypothetical protein